MSSGITTSTSRSGSRVCVVFSSDCARSVICHDLSAQPGKTRVRRKDHYSGAISDMDVPGLLEMARHCISRFDKTKLWMREFGSDYSEIDCIIRQLESLS